MKFQGKRDRTGARWFIAAALAKETARVLLFAVFVWFAVVAVLHVSDHGLRSVVERIWEGPQGGANPR